MRAPPDLPKGRDKGYYDGFWLWLMTMTMAYDYDGDAII